MLNDLAVQSCRVYQSDETGFVHSFYGKKQPPYQAISVQDNFLFALALCRLKTMEGVQEGKALLEKLLMYQNREGLFPQYLHEFPYCYDRAMGACLLPIIYELHRHFHHVLGMGDRLKTTMEKLLTPLLEGAETTSLPNRFRLGGALLALGEQGGHKYLKIDADHPSLYIPKHLGEMLSGALLAENLDLLPWMKRFWHPTLNCYSGPFNRVHFAEGKGVITLYDLYMAQESGIIPARFKAPHLSLLKAALVFPLPHVERKAPVDAVWGENYSYAWGKGQYPFAFQWGNGAHCLLYAPGAEVHYSHSHHSIKLAPPKEEGHELSLFISPMPEMKILVNGMPATTFRSSDRITIEDADMKIEWVFVVQEGIFQGHLSKASLPTETQNFGEKRFDAYEWQLAWRSISRPHPCETTLHFSYAPKA